jgi:uncharacterized membrane protein YsdA (DUF1294 family)
MDILMKSSSFPKRVSVLFIVSAFCGVLLNFFWVVQEDFGPAFFFAMLVTVSYGAYVGSFLCKAKEGKAYFEFLVAGVVLATAFALMFGAYYGAVTFVCVVAIMGMYRFLWYLLYEE